MQVNESDIYEVVGRDLYQLVTSRAGDSVQVNLRNIKQYAQDDEKKVDLLKQAKAKLTDAGYQHVQLRLSARDQSGNWISWPSLWVNAQPRQATGADPEAARLKAEIELRDELIALHDEGHLTDEGFIAAMKKRRTESTQTVTQTTNEDESPPFGDEDEEQAVDF